MYRKGPASLRSLPRVSLPASGSPSAYRLRANYGWKRRFGGETEEAQGHLYCTAEAAAALLESSGDEKGAEVALTLLDEFQSRYEAERLMTTVACCD